MLSLPLPFVVTLLLMILIIRMVRRNEQGLKEKFFFMALLAICTIQSILSGLRWSYHIQEVRMAQPMLAALLPVLTWAAFTHISPASVRILSWKFWAHLIPLPIIAGLMVTKPEWIDPILIMLSIGYSIAMLRTVISGPSVLQRLSLNGVIPAFAALKIAAFLLLGLAVIDTIVFVDFDQWQGAHAAVILTVANLLTVLALGAAAVVAETNHKMDNPEASPETGHASVLPQIPRAVDENELPGSEDREILEKVDELLGREKLYQDPNLSLSRLARRAGIPARQISIAINRVRSMNVSQYVNQYRINEACRLLRDTDDSVTKIIYDAGFQSKSNFNREFRRITGLSPTDWRVQNTNPVPAKALA